MAEKCFMDLEKLAYIANILLKDKISARSTISYEELFTAQLLTETNESAAKLLGITTDSLEHTLSRNIKKLFTNKTRNNTWNNFLYNLLGYKKCTGCGATLELQNFSKYHKSPDGYGYYCKDCRAIARKDFSKNNPEYAKNNYINNKAEYISRAIKYKTRRELATPPWANLDIIARIYDCAEDCHVDHIIPLQGDKVCGLHVETNLQYLSVEENLRKSNKFITDWD
jgi:hypothetical protein